MVEDLVRNVVCAQDFGDVVQGAVQFGGGVPGHDEGAFSDGEQVFRVIFYAVFFNVDVGRDVKAHENPLQH